MSLFIRFVRSASLGALAVIAIAASTAGVQAQTATSGVGVSSTGTVSVAPRPIAHDSDDDVVQLKQLVIQSVRVLQPYEIEQPSGGVSGPYAIGQIVAVYDPATQCERFSSTQSSSILPCSLAPARLYTITISTNTRLLLRNRQRATLDQFAAGNVINVYGFQAGDNGQAIDALIVRNMSTPTRDRRVQLNKVQIFSITQLPSGSTDAQYELIVGQQDTICLSLDDARRLPTPCPLSVAADQSRANSTSAISDLYFRPDYQRFRVRVTKATEILDRTRRAIPVSALSVGDTVNIAGALRTTIDTGVVYAEVVRDLSLPRSTDERIKISGSDGSLRGVIGLPLSLELTAVGGTAPYQWSTGDQALPPGIQLSVPSIVCITAPCISTNQTVYLTGTPTEPGTYPIVLTVTDRTGVRGTLPITVTIARVVEAGVRVRVATDKAVYRATETMTVSVTAQNTTATPRTLTFNSGCQASYAVLPGFSFDDTRACTAVLSSITLEPYGSKTWTFQHSFANMPTATTIRSNSYKVLGRVIGYGDDAVGITVTSDPVTSNNLPPVITGVSGPSVLTVGQTGTWSVSARDPEGGALTYAVAWGDTSATLPPIAAQRSDSIRFDQSASFSHTYATAGTYSITFTVYDAAGLGVRSTLTTTVTQSGSHIDFLGPPIRL